MVGIFSISPMNAHSLHSLLQDSVPLLLLHVLPEEVFAAKRVPGSRNACVYETAFLANVADLAPDKSTPIVVYGAGRGSLDAVTAVEKLKAAGYTVVQSLDGGLDEWEAAGLPLEGNRKLPETPVLDGRFAVDTEQSLVRWTGRNLFNHHNGVVFLSGGEIRLRQGGLESARFTIDMNSIACEDLVDEGWNAMLIQHLHDADFFDVANHPTAEFVARSVHPVAECADGQANYLLRGDFTLRGVKRPLEFHVLIASEDGKRLTGQGVLELDRTEYGSLYGSGKLYRYLGRHVVNDLVHLHVKLHADRVK